MGHGIVFSLLIIIGCLSCCEGLLISRISSVDIERVSSFHAYRYRSDSFINLRSYASKQRVSLSMRVDASTASAYFSIGDRVRVKSTVWHYPPSQPKFDSKDLIGIKT